MGAMARKTGSHSDITGPRVRDAALDLIARHGFAAVSMRQIASEVGVQAGALYNYTPDKQSLLADLMSGHMEALLEARQTAADRVAGLPALDRLEAFTRFHIRWHLPRRREVFVSYMELRNLTDGNFARVEGLRKVYEDELETILRNGADEETMWFDDSKIVTLAIIAMLTGVTNWFRNDGRLSADEIEEMYWHLVRGIVGARP